MRRDADSDGVDEIERHLQTLIRLEDFRGRVMPAFVTTPPSSPYIHALLGFDPTTPLAISASATASAELAAVRVPSLPSPRRTQLAAERTLP